MRKDLHDKQIILLNKIRSLTLIFILCVILARSVSAQGPDNPEIAIAPKPVGSGARALGQSAFIAVADDATAASWNPAGLINLEAPEASWVGAWKSNMYDYSSNNKDISIDRDGWNKMEINFMSYAHPIEIDSTDLVLSFNYHQVYDFGLKFDYTYQDGTDEVGLKGTSEGAVSAYSLASGFSMPTHSEVAIGASFNWYTKSLCNDYAWRETKRSWLNSDWGFTETETFDNFRGYNFTFGFLWNAYEKEENLLTLGLVYHTPFTAKMDRKVVEYRSGWVDPLSNTARLEMDFPLSLGAGVNYKFSDTRSVAFDMEWKQWSKFEQKNLNTGERSSPIGAGDGDIADTLAFRLGFEHLKFPEFIGDSVRALRYGVFYDPRPALDDPMPIYGFSLGYGWTVKDQFSLDLAYQFRWGEEESGRNLGQGLEDIDYSIKEHFFVVSLIKYF